ncbi:MAG: hypothetical protein ACRCYY_12880, partial [Trueperaceae bacterium]
MKRFLQYSSFWVTLCFTCLLVTAQSQTAITRYYASELQALEGEIRIPTDGLATLQFYTVIGEVKAGD